MDPITQGLLGAATAQAGPRQKLGPAATWVAAGITVVPDLDIFVTPLMSAVGADVGAMDRSVLHRGVSHSLFFVPILALVVAGIWWAIRRRQFGWCYLCCFVAALSHPLLDWCTSYGTQLFAPLTDHRYAADAVPIVDIIYTPILMVTLLGCWIVRRFGRRPRAATAIGIAGLAISVGYLVAGRMMHDVAVARGVAALRQHQAATAPGDLRLRSADAYPMLGTIFVWRVLLHDSHTWYVGRTHTLFDRPVTLVPCEQDDDAWVRRARTLPAAQTFEWFANGRVRAVSQRADGHPIVELHDMRYGRRTDSPQSLWFLEVRFAPDGRVTSVRRRQTVRGDDRSRGEMIGDAWRELFRP